MPVIIIVIGLAVILGIGSYLLRPEEAVTPVAEVVIPAPEPDNEVVTIPEEPAATTQEDAPTETAEAQPTKPTTPTPAPTPTPVVVTTPTPTTPTPTSTYADGVHTVTTAYVAPGDANHTVTVSLTLADDVVTNATVSYGGDKVSESTKYQNRFTDSYSTSVVGKSLDTIKLSRVGGASLTTGAFNDAVAKIKTEAKI